MSFSRTQRSDAGEARIRHMEDIFLCDKSCVISDIESLSLHVTSAQSYMSWLVRRITENHALTESLRKTQKTTLKIQSYRGIMLS